MNLTKQKLKDYCCENCGEQDNWIDRGEEGHILERVFFKEIFCHTCQNHSELVRKEDR
tara:strand:- start:47 stop:220 length:174 start_codon:yes stop_codon:yes gene_type:complete